MCTFTSRRKVHHRDDNFMVHAVFLDALRGVLKVVHIVERIEVPYGRSTVFGEHLGEKVDHLAASGVEHDRVDTA